MTITSNRLSSIYVLDQDEAIDFYVGVLGLEVATDADLGFMRWLTVRVPGDTKEILLERPGPPAHDPATAEEVRALVTKGAGGGWLGFNTDDVDGLYEKLAAQGVEITQVPTDQSYGRDFGLRDPFGNNLRIGRIPSPGMTLSMTRPEPVARAQSPGRGGSCSPPTRGSHPAQLDRTLLPPCPERPLRDNAVPVLRLFRIRVCACVGVPSGVRAEAIEEQRLGEQHPLELGEVEALVGAVGAGVRVLDTGDEHARLAGRPRGTRR